MQRTNKKTYLLIPPMPTPNGGLHLGHIGGPYLRVDILARYLRLCGHNALVITGIDSHESFVALQAAKEQVTPEKVNDDYHQRIAQDFQSMQIQLHAFINPLSPAWIQLYHQWHYQIFDALLQKKATTSLRESMPWDSQHRRYATGCWLQGRCPICRADVIGYFCDHCHAHFRPEEVIESVAYDQCRVDNLFLPIPKSLDSNAHASLQTLYNNFVVQQKGLLRLTTNSSWGLRSYAGKTLFSYGFIYAYYLMLGDIAGKIAGLEENAFDQHSSFITIASFGIDNAVPVLASMLGISAVCREYKPLDHYLVNYFYHLNDSKFSTSRRHAIWVRDIIHNINASSDIVRLYLATLDINYQHGEFKAENFLAHYNQTADWIEQAVIRPLATLPDQTSTDVDSDLLSTFHQLQSRQAAHLQPHHFQPHEAVKYIDEWLVLGKTLQGDTTRTFWWLKYLALLINPFMPDLSEKLWLALGYIELPQLEACQSKPSLALQRQLSVNTRRLRTEDVQACLQADHAYA